ncbi:hypothetical protein SAMN04487949_3014 [Halogranum gelatinilyticum]|uniref:Uncharacterized protein n=1 Tax=Halogranum gelatinilyticum TaxID=660521 RepID=A0A1G9XJ74_9EURY|nr:hypothetical protein [Halogranum gelatinilyticum]SDM96787.1 hypothetical protein SAMN04487949_3014 [Halogranum gelatinilyticum]
MSARTATTRNWDTPDACPFCGGHLTDGGAGFIDHIDDNPSCAEEFHDWRSMVASDMSGEWGG